mmetsp:Transcript_2760/g.7272  ORF Transcript_2760/g.7272 Transcript_2760/m.7272 type:complete len:392 (+) Transcript_2760:60-1235(+)
MSADTDSVPYWLIATPITSGYGPQDEWNNHVKKTGDGLAENYKFNVPSKDLKVGTLDSLMALSDELVRYDTMAEATTFKIYKQLAELGKEGAAFEEPTIPVERGGAVSIDEYVRTFAWDEAKYPVKSPLKELSELLITAVSRMDDELKAKSAEYASLKGSKMAIERKEQGNLMVRSLDGLVKGSDFIDSEHLTTLLVVVPKFSVKEWNNSYATLGGGATSFVVPSSSKCLAEDTDTALMTVTLFRTAVESFKTNAREKRFIVRDFEYSAEGVAADNASKVKVGADFEKTKVMFMRWCKTNFAEAYSAMLHLKAVRLFVESTLRYGVPPNFQAVLMKPKKEIPLRRALDSLYGHLASNDMIGGAEEETMPGVGGEFFPYVFLTVATAPVLVG